MITQPKKEKLNQLKLEYEQLRTTRNDLLKLITESELPEMVYNSNAIENSTLTLKETEKILLEHALMRTVSLRETFEATNLARVIKYLYLVLCESFNKRLAYLRGNEIVKLSEYAKINNINAASITNAAKRQTIPAFRQEGIWRIEKGYISTQ